ncbi:MAG: glycosyltransferase family 4 protein, partial [Isosphaeraceae bacterium]
TPGGEVWSPGPFAYRFWLRYLDVFDHVRVVARARRVDAASPGWVRSDGSGVSFIPVTHYLGPWQYLLRRHRVRSDVRSAMGPSDAVILRVGSQIAACLEPQLRRTRRPYGVEVVGDPYDVFAPGAVVHPLRPFFRWWFSRQLRRQCAGACGAAYVTEWYLQRRYPPGGTAFATHFSSLEMPETAFCARAGKALSTHFSDVELSENAFTRFYRLPRRAESSVRLISVGSLEQMYKAPDVLLDAVGMCVRDGIELELVWLGGGRYQASLEAKARSMGLGSLVHFHGQLNSVEAVRAELDRSDVFVLPSRTEGLPRAMVEAMARALPCIGSTVGGIPELLLEEDMVSPGNVVALAAKIREVVTDPDRMARMSSRNLEKARDYKEDKLRERRIEFYRYIEECTCLWIKKGEVR